MRSISRRSFLQAGVGATLATAVSPRIGRAQLANEAIGLGFIACGDRGLRLMGFFDEIEGVNVAGICDPDHERLARAKSLYPKAEAWTDLRDLIASDRIDATVIATCNHWHCLAVIWSMQEGKDVYVEKPLSHSPWEGQQTVAAARKYSRICQVGTHQRSDPLQGKIKQLLHESQSLGKILAVRANRFGVRKPIGKRATPLDLSGKVDIELWQGPAAAEPIYRNQLQYDWHWDWNTGSGEMGNWGAHILDDICNNVFLDQAAWPKRIVAGGGRLAWGDAGETPNVQLAMIETASIPVVMTLSNLELPAGDTPLYPGPASGYVVYCEGGRLEGQRRKATAYDEDGRVLWEFATEGGNRYHQANFIEAVRSGDRSLLSSDVEAGHLSSTWCNLANIGCRVGENDWHWAAGMFPGSNLWRDGVESIDRSLSEGGLAEHKTNLQFSELLQFDSQTQQFQGAKAEPANRLLKRDYRSPFVVPEIV